MIPAFRAGIFLLPLIVLATLGTARAGVGSAVSTVATLDTRQPELTIAIDPVGDLFQGGQWFQATVTTGDDHPGLAPADHFLVAWVGESPVDTLQFDPLVQPATIDWQAPEVASAHVRLAAYSRDQFGNMGSATTPTFTVIFSVTDVPAPVSLDFGPARPNPFNPRVKFAIDLPRDGTAELTVYDSRGRRVRTLWTGNRAAGSHTATWDGRTEGDTRAAAGVYLFELVVRDIEGQSRQTRKAVLLP